MIRFCFVFVLFPFLAFAQPSQRLLQSCVIGEGGLPVADAHITIEGATQRGTATTENGCFTLEVSNWPIVLSVSHINFKPFSIELNQAEDLPAVLVLESVVRSLPDITVRANVKIDTVYHAPYSITDYVFYQDHIILMTRKGNVKGYSLILLDKDEKVLDDFSLQNVRAKNIYKTCDDNLFLLTGVNLKEIILENNKLRFGRNISRDDFIDDMASCVLANDSMAYFKRYYYQGQALQYSALTRYTEEHKEWKFPIIEDDPNMVRLVEETGNRMPWSGNLWEENISGGLRFLRDSRYQVAGSLKIFYPPINAPICIKDSTLCILNHFASKIQYFTPQAKLLHTVPINYHLHKKWRKKTYFDPCQEKAYTSFDTRTGVMIFPVDLETGQLGMGVEIPMDFIENVKIWNGQLYYLYRNRGKGEWNRRLHRIGL